MAKTTDKFEGKLSIRQLNNLVNLKSKILIVTEFEKSRLPHTQHQDTLHHQTIAVHIKGAVCQYCLCE